MVCPPKMYHLADCTCLYPPEQYELLMPRPWYPSTKHYQLGNNGVPNASFESGNTYETYGIAAHICCTQFSGLLIR
ncbi:hypothetical protein XELAEV_18041666mg [Xenopus laevis]|uniref:Uncharacterized protein n=1 Tax=Xenopus laevis TaxID=8355 RepID=A0A974C2L7_XENLA|nr:hypothetical protein XELAEV_18041666mg [Xenopus laevis]